MNGIEIIPPQANFFKKMLFTRSHRHFSKDFQGGGGHKFFKGGGGAVKYPGVNN